MSESEIMKHYGDTAEFRFPGNNAPELFDEERMVEVCFYPQKAAKEDVPQLRRYLEFKRGSLREVEENSRLHGPSRQAEMKTRALSEDIAKIEMILKSLDKEVIQ